MELYISRERSEGEVHLPGICKDEFYMGVEVAWDSTIDEYVHVFRTFLHGIGFTETQISDAFYDHLLEEEYLEDMDEPEEDEESLYDSPELESSQKHND